MCITEMYMHKSLITFQLRNFLFQKNPQKGFHEKKSWQLAGVLLGESAVMREYPKPS